MYVIILPISYSFFTFEMNLCLIQISKPLSASFRHISLSSSLSVAKLEKKDLPKRPSTPWVKYYTQNFPSSKISFPYLSTGELMKKISIDWKKLPEKEKGKFQELYENEKLLYAEKLASMPKEVIEDRKESKRLEKSDKQVMKNKRSAEEELRNLLTSLDKPKRGAGSSSFFLYCKDRRPQLANSLSNTDKVKMGEEWNNANVKIKELYEKKWKVQAETHGKQLEKWSLKMQEEGRNEEIALAQIKVNKARKITNSK